MLLRGILYVLVFLPCVVIFAKVRSRAVRQAVLLIGGYALYLTWGAWFAVVLLASTVMNFLLGKWLQRKAAALILAIGILLNLALLGSFKYLPEVAVNLPLSSLQKFSHLALPLGISFWTFQAMSYLFDLYRGENVRLVDGGRQRRCFTGISDGIDALMKMIDNRDGRANRRIYNVGNPDNSLSVRELAMEMLRIAATYPEYRVNAAKVRLVDTTAAEYYGKGYQDVENRVPKIDNTRADLEWSPRVSMQEALRQIFDAYRGEIAQAGQLLEQEVRP